MKKIFGIIVAVSAFLASCSSPYYPEYVKIVSLGATTSSLICEREEGAAKLNVYSNVEYTATITSGSEWLSFADTEGEVRTGNGNTVLVFNHLQNNNEKRVAYLVLAAENRRDTIKIKQKSIFEDYLEIHPEDKAELFLADKNTRMELPELGGQFELRLRTSAQSDAISFWTDRTDALVDMKVENSVLSFSVKENLDGQPRLMTIRLSYVDGWDDVKTLDVLLKQKYDALN